MLACKLLLNIDLHVPPFDLFMCCFFSFCFRLSAAAREAASQLYALTQLINQVKKPLSKTGFEQLTILLYTSLASCLLLLPLCVCVCNFVVILFPIQTVGDAISDLLTVEVILMYKGVGTQL